MAMLERVREWLETYPGMARLSGFEVDELGTAADCGGLFPQGLTEVERREDILGNVEVLNEYRFSLRCVFGRTPDGGGAEANAQWVLAFQDWVQEQSARGTAAQLGGEGTQQGTARAEKGALSQNSEDGTATYEVALTIKFKKRYEG